MAKFTAQQANNCTINRCEAISEGGTHSHWILEVTDEDGIRYSFENNTIPGDATDTAVRNSLRSLLINTEKKTPKPIIKTTEKETIIGTKVGD